MSDHSSQVHTAGKFIPADEPSAVAHRKLIWKTFWILLLITGFEFLIAFTVSSGPLRVAIFVSMTLVKAFYIVAEFMHLRYEAKALVYSIAIPVIFIVWLIIALLTEAGYILLSHPVFNT